MTEQDFLPGKTGAFQETYGGGRKRRKVRMDLRLAMIACEVMVREVSFLTAQSEHIISVRWMKQGLHDNPSMLNRMLKEKIAEIEELNEQMSADKKFDAIVLGYGLCSNGVIGISAETLPLVIPKCDDCIALFLGSQSRYLELFRQYKGIYWYTPGWVERAFTPSPESYRRRLREYEETYGEEKRRIFIGTGKQLDCELSLRYFLLTLRSVDGKIMRSIPKMPQKWMVLPRRYGKHGLFYGIIERNMGQRTFSCLPAGICHRGFL